MSNQEKSISAFKNALQSLQQVKVMPPSNFAWIDLSASNGDLTQIDTENPEALQNYIERHLQQQNANVAIGGYNEKRTLYKNSTIFNDQVAEERNIHIGVDLWADAGTPILAALNGKIHSLKNNIGKGNYGPTVIVEHLEDGNLFYTLYGHLALENLKSISIGDTIKQGQQIATLGNPNVNGGYAPHLHFQIINDIADNNGDYPGVCSAKTLDFYLENCPDPNLLLKIKPIQS